MVKDADLDAHVLVAFFAGRGMGYHRTGIAEAFVSKMRGVEALVNEVVVNEFCALYREDEERVLRG